MSTRCRSTFDQMQQVRADGHPLLGSLDDPSPFHPPTRYRPSEGLITARRTDVTSAIRWRASVHPPGQLHPGARLAHGRSDRFRRQGRDARLNITHLLVQPQPQKRRCSWTMSRRVASGMKASTIWPPPAPPPGRGHDLDPAGWGCRMPARLRMVVVLPAPLDRPGLPRGPARTRDPGPPGGRMTSPARPPESRGVPRLNLVRGGNFRWR